MWEGADAVGMPTLFGPPISCFLPCARLQPSPLTPMSAPQVDAAALEAALAAADAAVTQQGDAVRSLKAAAKEGSASKVRVRRVCGLCV